MQFLILIIVNLLKAVKLVLKVKKLCDLFPNKNNFSDRLLNLIHSDLCGPMRVTSNEDSWYFVTLIDYKSRLLIFLKAKDEVMHAFIKYKAAVENYMGKKRKTLGTDMGLEYCHEQFNKYLQEFGIKREFQAPMTNRINKTSALTGL